MAVVLTVAGILLVLITLFDILRTLFDPEAQGLLTDAVCWAVWGSLKALPGPMIRYSGPVAYGAVLATWTLLLLTAWALLFLAHLPQDFTFAGGIDPDERSGFGTAFYISLMTLSTLGYGDISPTSTLMRVVGTSESLVGFLLLSAAITWILMIYQDLETRRSLAHSTTLLMDALDREHVVLADLKPDSAERVLSDVTTQILTVTGSLSQFPITYFFRISDERQSLAVMSLFLLEMSEDLQHEQLPVEVRVRARMLSRALDHLAQVLAGKFVLVDPEARTRDVLRAYARDHEHSVTHPGEDIEEEQR